MSTTVATTAPKSGNVDVQGLFKTLGPQYKRNRKLADAVIAILNAKGGNVDQSMVEVRTLIDNLKVLSENGVGYTPPSGLGFGSENASSIADAILGQRTATSTIRSKFAAVA